MLPPYTAVIGCDATESAEVPKVATPDAFNVPVPITVAPSLKVTVPVGVAVAGATGATVAVNVTDCPNTDGLRDEVTAVVVSALFTTCVTLPWLFWRVLSALQPAPWSLKFAWMSWLPAVRLDVVNVA